MGDLTNCKDRNELSSRLSRSFAVSSITFEQPTSQQSFIIQDPKHSMINTENSNSLSLFSDSVIFPSDDAVVHTSSISKITQLEKDCKGIRMQNTEDITTNESNQNSLDKPATYEDNISSSDESLLTSRSTNSRFEAIKSYANILSGGLKKVGSVFGKKSKEVNIPNEQTKSIDQRKSVKKDYKENIEPFPHTINHQSESNLQEKPEIPGLVFKTDLERRPSRKKKRSRPVSSFESEPINQTCENLSTEKDMTGKKEVTSECEHDVNVVVVESKHSKTLQMETNDQKHSAHCKVEEAQCNDLNKTNSLKRKNSKMKKKETPPKRFNDEIDQALHEINLLDTEEKRKKNVDNNSLKRRHSKKVNRLNAQADLKETKTNQIIVSKDDAHRGDVDMENQSVKDTEKITAKSTSSLSDSMQDVYNDATKPSAEITLAKKINQESNIDIRLSQKYSQVAKVLEEDSATELSEVWMIDDEGTMHSESDEDNESLQADKKDKKISSSKFVKPQELLDKESMNDLSEAWLVDDVGTIDSDSEGENENIVFLNNVNVTEKTNKDKAQTTKDLSEAWMIDDMGKKDSESKKENEAQPAGKKERVNTERVNDLSEAWMIDDVGAMNSESEDENEGSVETNVCSSNTDAIKNENEIPQAKTTDLPEAWMIDDVGTIESESEEENISSPEDKKSTYKKDISENKRKIKEDTLSNNVSTIDPESEKENIATMETKNPSLNVRNSQDIEEVKENTTKADLSDAWMIDDVGTINSESEEENEGSAETNNIHNNEKEIIKKKTTDLSEAWMIDDVGTMESESEEDDDHESPKSKKITDKENIYENK